MTAAGQTRRKGQSLQDRLREIKSEEGWIDIDDPDWKQRLLAKDKL